MSIYPRKNLCQPGRNVYRPVQVRRARKPFFPGRFADFSNLEELHRVLVRPNVARVLTGQTTLFPGLDRPHVSVTSSHRDGERSYMFIKQDADTYVLKIITRVHGERHTKRDFIMGD